MTTPELRAARCGQIRQIMAGIEQQMADGEALLLEHIARDELRKVIDRLANLKVAKHNLEIILEADTEA